jgi:hypothetical protein
MTHGELGTLLRRLAGTTAVIDVAVLAVTANRTPNGVEDVPK